MHSTQLVAHVVCAVAALLAATVVQCGAQSVTPSTSPSPQASFDAVVELFPLGSVWSALDANVDLAGATSSPR